MTKTALTFPLPMAALDDRLGFLGTSGAGKTYTAGTAVERLLDRSARVVIVDPLGVWWGLRLRATGDKPSHFNVVIFGGPHGDLPISEHAGGLFGETAATMAESCIVDLSQLGTGAAERRFMTAFLDHLYRSAPGEPFHLIVDEADLFAPQRPQKGDETLLNRMEQIVRRGRVKGFIPWLISQRPAVISKNVLSQVDGLIAFKLTSSQDRDALDAWIEGQADREQGRAIKASLPTLDTGEGIVWLPGRGILDRQKFPPKITFDSSRTPKRGEVIETALLVPVDISALKQRLDTVTKETEANDPRRLRARIAELETQLKQSTKGVAEYSWKQGFAQGTAEAAAEYNTRLAEQQAAIGAAVGFLLPHIQKDGDSVPVIDVRRPAAPPVIDQQPARAKPSPRPALSIVPATTQPAPQSNGANGHLPEGEARCLTAAAQHANGVTRQQITILLGYKRSTRDTYIHRLRGRGYGEMRGERFVATQAGIAALGDQYDPLPTGDLLRQHLLGTLPAGERQVLEVAIGMYPNGATRGEIGEATGFKRSTRDTYIQRLRAREIVEVVGAEVVVSPMLFD